MSRIPLPRDEAEYGNRDVDNSNTTDHIIPPAHLIPCPYNPEHKVPVQDFNGHLWNCRGEKMSFYPHSLQLKRCPYNATHLLPEEEMPLHERFCEKFTRDAREILNRPQINMKVCELEETMRQLKELDEEDDPHTKKKVGSDVEDSDLEEEDRMETIKRLTMLELEKTIFNPKS